VQPVFTATYQQAYVPLFDARVGWLAFSSVPFVVGQPVGATVVVGDSLLESLLLFSVDSLLHSLLLLLPLGAMGERVANGC
jgi:hypothetical protein